ncbi:MAG TPA: phosphoribosylanthranilate isomerase [Deltaproteobacteria bacterium]|nr:phosphoribosylanthranilate isomerase [Deltaproteobacteria bacterium]
MPRVKVCGITSPGDAEAAARAGADALGFIFYEKSPRRVTPEAAAAMTAGLGPFVTTVGVFVDEAVEEVNRTVEVAGLDRVQLHGREGPDYCAAVDAPVIKAFRVGPGWDGSVLDDYDVTAFLLDTYRPGAPGGTGESFDWRLAVEAAGRHTVILAGGLTCENVARAVRTVRPYAVDVCSGVESAPGVKDRRKLAKFIETVRTL